MFMLRFMVASAIVTAVLLVGIVMVLADPRTDCPTPTPCKVVTINADEEKALMGERMVFDTAVAARQLDMLPIANYFKNKLQAAPAGDAPKPGEVSSILGQTGVIEKPTTPSVK